MTGHLKSRENYWRKSETWLSLTKDESFSHVWRPSVFDVVPHALLLLKRRLMIIVSLILAAKINSNFSHFPYNWEIIPECRQQEVSFVFCRRRHSEPSTCIFNFIGFSFEEIVLCSVFLSRSTDIWGRLCILVSVEYTNRGVEISKKSTNFIRLKYE